MLITCVPQTIKLYTNLIFSYLMKTMYVEKLHVLTNPKIYIFDQLGMMLRATIFFKLKRI